MVKAMMIGEKSSNGLSLGTFLSLCLLAITVSAYAGTGPTQGGERGEEEKESLPSPPALDVQVNKILPEPKPSSNLSDMGAGNLMLGGHRLPFPSGSPPPLFESLFPCPSPDPSPLPQLRRLKEKLEAEWGSLNDEKPEIPGASASIRLCRRYGKPIAKLAEEDCVGRAGPVEAATAPATSEALVLEGPAVDPAVDDAVVPKGPPKGPKEMRCAKAGRAKPAQKDTVRGTGAAEAADASARSQALVQEGKAVDDGLVQKGAKKKREAEAGRAKLALFCAFRQPPAKAGRGKADSLKRLPPTGELRSDEDGRPYFELNFDMTARKIGPRAAGGPDRAAADRRGRWTDEDEDILIFSPKKRPKEAATEQDADTMQSPVTRGSHGKG